AITVDHIEAEDNRDVEARLLHSDVLQPVDLFHIDKPENGTDLALGDGVVRFLSSQPGHHDSGGFRKLAYLFVKVHLLEQSAGALLGFRADRRVLCKGGRSRDKESDDEECAWNGCFFSDHGLASLNEPASIAAWARACQQGCRIRVRRKRWPLS